MDLWVLCVCVFFFFFFFEKKLLTLIVLLKNHSARAICSSKMVSRIHLVAHSTYYLLLDIIWDDAQIFLVETKQYQKIKLTINEFKIQEIKMNYGKILHCYRIT
jgi:hypothetical protein